MKNSVVFGKKTGQEFTVKKPITARRKKNPLLLSQQFVPGNNQYPNPGKSYIDDTFDHLPPKDEFRPNSSLGPEKIRMSSPKKFSAGNCNADALTKTTPRRTHMK